MKDLAYVLAGIVVLIIGICMGVFFEKVTISEPSYPAPPAEKPTDENVTTAVYNVHVRTVEHDGHKFIVAHGRFDAGMSVVHHPSCPCLETP